MTVGLLIGAPHHSYTARGRTHHGGSLVDLESDWALSPPVTGHPVTCHSVTSQPVTGHPVTGQPVTGQPVPGQPGTRHQSFTYDFQSPITNQFISSHAPVNVPEQTNAPSVSSYVSQGSTHRLPNILWI